MAVVNKSEGGRRKQTEGYIGSSSLQEAPSPRGDFQTEKQAASTQKKRLYELNEQEQEGWSTSLLQQTLKSSSWD